ncbi:hypothetical protein ACFC58_39630 [Kitasatospora purpeofusca]|uniref:hypothetical protein n=1 Tax=Kitasatospora purpeofusca TaxID=67352 RepID=UPI0035DB46C3
MSWPRRASIGRPGATCGAQLTPARLHHLLDLDLFPEPDSDADTARTTGPGKALEQVLGGFELYRITQRAAGACAP